MYTCGTCKQFVSGLHNCAYVNSVPWVYYNTTPDTTQSAEVIRQLLKRIADLEARLDQKK